jgi:ribosomal protein S18 acetylase RimI-like enzyme
MGSKSFKITLVENIPVDTRIIADLIKDPSDLYLVWPLAAYPFDEVQWLEVLNPLKGNVPLLIYADDELIGHAALRRTEQPLVYMLSFLYLLPRLRGKGLGQLLVGTLEKYARVRLFAEELRLVVRDYNPQALNCYLKCGFQEVSREGTLIRMSKMLHAGDH